MDETCPEHVAGVREGSRAVSLKTVQTSVPLKPATRANAIGPTALPLANVEDPLDDLGGPGRRSCFAPIGA